MFCFYSGTFSRSQWNDNLHIAAWFLRNKKVKSQKVDASLTAITRGHWQHTKNTNAQGSNKTHQVKSEFRIIP